MARVPKISFLLLVGRDPLGQPGCERGFLLLFTRQLGADLDVSPPL